jgi:hypothetical protein
MDDEILRAKEWPWLADQLVEWPERRVHPDRTMSIGALHKMGADVIRKAVEIEAAAQKVITAMGGNTPDWLRDEMQALEDALTGTRARTENEKLGDALLAFADLGGVIVTLGGNCPVQCDGKIDGQWFYFRARGERWTFTVAPTDAEIFSKPTFHLERAYGVGSRFDAGWMEQSEAVGFMCEGVKAFRVQRDLQDAYEAQGKPGKFDDFVIAMASDPKGTLQEAAKQWLEPQL